MLDQKQLNDFKREIIIKKYPHKFNNDTKEIPTVVELLKELDIKNLSFDTDFIEEEIQKCIELAKVGKIKTIEVNMTHGYLLYSFMGDLQAFDEENKSIDDIMDDEECDFDGFIRHLCIQKSYDINNHTENNRRRYLNSLIYRNAEKGEFQFFVDEFNDEDNIVKPLIKQLLEIDPSIGFVVNDIKININNLYPECMDDLLMIQINECYCT